MGCFWPRSLSMMMMGPHIPKIHCPSAASPPCGDTATAFENLPIQTTGQKTRCGEKDISAWAGTVESRFGGGSYIELMLMRSAQRPGAEKVGKLEA